MEGCYHSPTGNISRKELIHISFSFSITDCTVISAVVDGIILIVYLFMTKKK